jgi:hypothetical protein
MSKIEVNTIEPQCGTTLTLGASGDTVTLASGASQSGFGRTGTVDWQTGSIKTANFTAANGEGYFCNTTGGAFTATLPSSPSAGSIVSFKDYAQTFASNSLTVGRNSSNIEGVANDLTLNGNAEAITLVYVDSTKGWVLVNESTTIYGPEFISATGGDSVITCGNFKTHVFTSPGNFIVSTAGNPSGSTKVDYFVTAGGGGGGGDGGGGGGAGGFRLSNCVGSIPAPTMSPLVNACGALTVSATTYPITVGAGGNAGTYGPTTAGTPGSVSTFSSISSAGGGAGGLGAPGCAGEAGGSGGGGTRSQPGGAGNTPPVSPPQGNDGGNGPTPNGDGGGGAGAVGGGATSNNGGVGGIGSFIADTFMGSSAPSYGTPGPVSSTRYFAAGGGGGGDQSPSTGAAGGSGGAGTGGSRPNSTPGTSGTVNTGSGGGGGGVPGNAGAGGSGIVMIRYKFQ